MSDRFYAESSGASWCVRDRDILIKMGPMRGLPHIVEWFSRQSDAEAKVAELNKARGRAADEPKCVLCGAQPAGPAGAERPLCGSCHSRLADMHG